MDPVSTADAREDTASVSGLLIEFGGWLDRQRGLAPVTIHNYCWHAGQFLAALPQPAQVSVSLLDAGTVTAFMVEYCRDRNTNSAKSMARSVRSFLRFAHATGRTSAGLRGAVPSSSGWHLASLPRSVPAADLERLLAVAARSRFTATGRRDYAILLLLARLGLRRGEVASLRLDDIDWRAGELTVTGKGNRAERLPLPAEPGEAIVAWLTDGRPECETRSVFTTLRPPGRPLVAWGDRPCRGQCMPDCRACPDRRAPPASHAGHGHAAGRGVAPGGGAGAAPPERDVHRDLRQGR